jgi:DNA-binding winged helix-turn-helix (wHTH) protein/tetratricopeptide (TPR) repeat protein
MTGNATTYAFGDFLFDPSESLLVKHGRAVALPPKAIGLLEKLVENAGSVVTKEELIREIWDDLAIEESAVSRTVFLIRAALGDDPKSHSFIQTVPKKGYRFVAEVSTLNGSNGDAILVAGLSRDSAAEPRSFPAIHLAAAFLLLAAGTAVAYLGFFNEIPISSGPSLLVMPVTAAGKPGGDELLEMGLADALIHHLASDRKITVRPLSATRSYTGRNFDPVQAGREQKVSNVLSASYQRADGTLRILARLINVETGETEESYKVETGESGIFAIQDAFAAEVSRKLASRLGGAAEHVKGRGTTNEEAYRHYFQGMALYDKRNGAKAVESFESAIELDPNYARAWAGKAVALGAMPSLGDSTSPELYKKTTYAANRALELDGSSAEAYSALSGAKLTYAHDFAGAEMDCARAMELDPTSPIVLQSYSFLLVSRGRSEESIEIIRRALDIEPTSFFSQTSYTHALYFAGRYDEAYSQYVRLSELQPDRMPIYEWMIRALEASGRESEAKGWLVKAMRIRKADEDQVRRIERAYHDSGWAGVLRARIAAEKSTMNYFRQAGLYARLGNKDAAFELLEKAYEQRPPIFVTLRVEPQFDPIRDDPRFDALVARMEAGPR